jgi:hypothetical protein
MPANAKRTLSKKVSDLQTATLAGARERLFGRRIRLPLLADRDEYEP